MKERAVHNHGLLVTLASSRTRGRTLEYDNMNADKRTQMRFTVAVCAYVVFFLIPVTAPTNPKLVLAQVVTASVAFVSMSSVVLKGSIPAKIAASLLLLPALAFLIYIAIAAVDGGLIPADA